MFDFVLQTNPLNRSYFLTDFKGYTYMFWLVVGPEDRYLGNPELSALLKIALGPIRNQYGHEICWAYIVCDLISSVRYLHGLDNEFVPLSPLFLFQNMFQKECENAAPGEHYCRSSGLAEGLMYAQRYGIPREKPGCEEFDCTKSKKFVAGEDKLYKIRDIFYYSTLELALERLKTGYSVAAGLKLFQGWQEYHQAERDDDMKIYVGPKHGQGFYINHAVLMMRFRLLRGERVVICKMSNGKGSANDGYIAVSVEIMLSAVGATKKVRERDPFCDSKPQYLLSGFYSIDMEMGEEPRINVDQDVAKANLKYKVEDDELYDDLFTPRYGASSLSKSAEIQVKETPFGKKKLKPKCTLSSSSVANKPMTPITPKRPTKLLLRRSLNPETIVTVSWQIPLVMSFAGPERDRSRKEAAYFLQQLSLCQSRISLSANRTSTDKLQEGACNVFGPEVLDLTEDDLVEKFAAGISMVTSLALAASFSIIAAAPHMFINAYKNALAISEYSFPQAEKDPSKFVVAVAADAAGAAKVEEKKQEVEESDKEGYGG